jgi:shikimate kinase
MVLFLIGFMGSGKTYSATALSREWGIPHVDLDEWIDRTEGMSIQDIFANKGEEYFRTIETQALKQVWQGLTENHQKNTAVEATAGHIIKKFNIFAIVSVGGGTPCFHGNMEWMNEHGYTVWLDPTIDELVGRLKKEREKRPLVAALKDHELREYVEQKMNERTKYYSKAMLRVKSDLVLREELKKVF